MHLWLCSTHFSKKSYSACFIYALASRLCFHTKFVITWFKLFSFSCLTVFCSEYNIIKTKVLPCTITPLFFHFLVKFRSAKRETPLPLTHSFDALKSINPKDSLCSAEIFMWSLMKCFRCFVWVEKMHCEMTAANRWTDTKPCAVSVI